jgi:hypothetical protein
LTQLYSPSYCSPSTWADEEITVNATQLPAGTEINSNGAGDAFTSGLLVAAMLRNTGISMQYSSSPAVAYEEDEVNTSLDSVDIVSTGSMNSPTTSPSKKVTPYSLYIRENYVTLKAQCSDDKKIIFAKCNQMWEQESEETKMMYERKANEEMALVQEEATKALSTLDSQSGASLQTPKLSRNLNLANQPMNLETAAQFASLVAARHVDASSRDASYLNINTIREQSSMSRHGLEEI